MVAMLDKLYSVSDLHMGGAPGTMAFREIDALAWLIDHVTTDSAERVGLLLNGDIFDFLAEPDAQEFRLDAEDVVERLSRGVLSPIFAALERFVARPNRRLVVQLGNHDIELALPDVQSAFLRAIGADASDRRTRVELETSGRGWFANVSGYAVQAIHGNVADPWNVVDHEALARTAAAQAGRIDAIIPPETNAGTMLVIRAMNAIKKVFPFVDLLKPETAPLMAILEAIDAPTSYAVLLQCLAQLEVQRGLVGDLLGAHENAPSRQDGPTFEIAAFLKATAAQPTESLLMQAERDLDAGITPRSLVIGERGQLRSLADAARVKVYDVTTKLTSMSRTMPDRDALREALRHWLAEDRTFDPRDWSAIDRRIVRHASRGVDVLLAGHTHLAREQPGRRLTYINTGTWMRVLSLQRSSFLETNAQFEPLWRAIHNPEPRKSQKDKLDELDALNLDIRKRPVAVVDHAGATLKSVATTGAAFALVPYGGVP